MTHLSLLERTLDDLDALGEIMEEMLQTQDEVQVCRLLVSLSLKPDRGDV